MTGCHPARDGSESELHDLRKAHGHLDDIKLANEDFTVRALGNQDVEVALTRLVDLAAEHSDWDVDAPWQASVLPATAKLRSTDSPSTASDTLLTCERPTQLIVGGAPRIQPRARRLIDAREDHGILTYRLHLAVPPRIRMGAPIPRIDKQEVEIGMPEIGRG